MERMGVPRGMRARSSSIAPRGEPDQISSAMPPFVGSSNPAGGPSGAPSVLTSIAVFFAAGGGAGAWDAAPGRACGGAFAAGTCAAAAEAKSAPASASLAREPIIRDDLLIGLMGRREVARVDRKAGGCENQK